MSTWEERMAARAAERREAAEAEEDARVTGKLARTAAANPPVHSLETGPCRDEPHTGHWEHIHPSHAGMVVCQCGAWHGPFSYAFEWALSDPGPCPVCIARGIPLNGR